MGGFEALIYIVNLNQIGIFLWVALAIWVYLWLKISLLYDLYFKNPGALARARAKHESVEHWMMRALKIFGSACMDRIQHFRSLKMFARWANYLLLPGMIFWATVALLYLHLGWIYIQQTFAALSGLAIIVAYWYIKEIYTRKEEKVGLDIFAALSSIKIYTALVVFGAVITLTRYYCLPPRYLALGIFCVTFFLIYQALFQHNFTGKQNIFWTLLISLTQGTLGYFVYLFWSYNNITAAVFLTAFYNLFWGVFHHALENTLGRQVFWEVVIVSLFIAALAVSITNFRAQILPGCS